MILTNKTHITLLVLYGMIGFLAIWGLASHSEVASGLPLAFWMVLGTVGAAGAMLEILLHIRTREALNQMKKQIQKMSEIAEVGLVMVEEQWPVEGLAGMLNEYLTLIRKKMNDLSRERKELNLLVQVADAEKHNTEAIVASSSDAVIVIDAFGELTLANRLAQELFGFKLPDSKNRPIEQIISESRLQAMLDTAQWKYREPVTFEYELKARTYVVTISPVYIQSDELWALTMILHDVTQERQLAQLKNDFVNHVSHELRTPLSSIKAYIELLVDGDIKTAEGRTDFYKIIQSEADRLDRFIENMLNLNRIESGLMSVEFAKLNLKDELRQAAALVEYLAREKSIILENNSFAEEISIHADRDLLRQVVLNLLSNAIKYTNPGGKVRLDAGVSEDRESYWISVEDTGIGIAADERDKIFEKFYRSSGGRSLSGGTGLGLALVKKVVEQIHGGTIEVQSDSGRGSKFILHLLVKPAESSSRSEIEQEAIAL
ncbi:MAG: ATP-binding protein [Phycisphaerae bacterium]